jgi:hypothetical protein
MDRVSAIKTGAMATSIKRFERLVFETNFIIDTPFFQSTASW